MLKHVLVSICVCAALAGVLSAQTGVAQIQGTITDTSGAVIPNAAVTLEHIQTENKFQTTTNTAGFYVFPSLQTGDYRLEVTVPGMQRWQGNAVLAAVSAR